MLLNTLGGLIKDYRIKKRISQLDISLKLGWKDTSRISKIEQGRVGKPNRDTAERLMQALDLTEQERGNFLLVGGYLPTDEEIKIILNETDFPVSRCSAVFYRSVCPAGVGYCEGRQRQNHLSF